MAALFTDVIPGEVPPHRAHEGRRPCARPDHNPPRPGPTPTLPRRGARGVPGLSQEGCTAGTVLVVAGGQHDLADPAGALR